MALINRVSRLFKADFHAVLDHIEEPEQLLKQAIRDMEDELGACELAITSRMHEQETVLARRKDIQSAIQETDEQLDLCFESGRDELARGLIRKKLEAGRLVRHLDSAIEANEQFLTQQRKCAEENRSALEGLKQKADVFASRPVSRGTGPGIDESGFTARAMTVGDDEVEIAFLHEKSLRSAS